MDEMSRCGERRALNARERSGDATSGDERRRDEARARRERSRGAKRDFCSKRSRCATSARALLRDFCSSSRKAEVVLLAYGSVGRSPEYWGGGARVLPLVVHQKHTWPLHPLQKLTSVTQVEKEVY